MNSSYIYAGTLAKTLGNKLLSENQIELLLSAKNYKEFSKTLDDTYIARYVARNGGKTLASILEDSVTDAKKELVRMAPEPKILHVLWLKYDFYNLRTCIKGKIAGSSQEEVLEKCFETGTIDPKTLYRAYTEKKLANFHRGLASAQKEAEKFKEIGDIDLAINKHYLLSAREFTNPFVKEYINLLIDFFNIKSQLRLIHFHSMNPKDVFISGGSFNRKELSEEANILTRLKRFGGEKRWKEAVESFRQSKNYTVIEKKADEYMYDWLKLKSLELFSPAPLFLYFNSIKANAQLISTIGSGKKVGVSEFDIRSWVRKIHSE